MRNRTRKPTREGAVLRKFRTRRGLTKEQVARAADVKPETVGLWEGGSVNLSRARLVEVLGHFDIPPEAVDAALLADDLAFLSQGLPLPTEPSRTKRAWIHQTAAAAGGCSARATCTELTIAHHHETAREHRDWAETRWHRLTKLPVKVQEIFVRALFGGVRSWALAERLCLASTRAAAHQASEALRLARLAVHVAEQSPGAEPWRLRLRGWCLCFLANALRVGGQLPASEKTFAQAEDLWVQGATGDPYGLLDGTRRLDLRASLLRQLGRFDEALALIEQSLAISPPEAVGRLLIQKSATHNRAGHYEVALLVLEDAEPKVDKQQDQRLFFLHRSNTALALCHLDRYETAEPLVALIEVLAKDLGNELEEERARWLRGRTWAGLGRHEEALAVLSRVRRYFRDEEIAYDFALVSLEVAELLLKQGRTRLVQEIAKEMLWIFKTQKVHKEALAALTLFCQAAKEGEAKAEWTRNLIKYLYRAQHNPHLRFDP